MCAVHKHDWQSQLSGGFVTSFLRAPLVSWCCALFSRWPFDLASSRTAFRERGRVSSLVETRECYRDIGSPVFSLPFHLSRWNSGIYLYARLSIYISPSFPILLHLSYSREKQFDLLPRISARNVNGPLTRNAKTLLNHFHYFLSVRKILITISDDSSLGRKKKTNLLKFLVHRADTAARGLGLQQP